MEEREADNNDKKKIKEKKGKKRDIPEQSRNDSFDCHQFAEQWWQ